MRRVYDKCRLAGEDRHATGGVDNQKRVGGVDWGVRVGVGLRSEAPVAHSSLVYRMKIKCILAPGEYILLRMQRGTSGGE